MIYIIAGPSFSCKSTVRKIIEDKLSISGMTVDVIRTMVSLLEPERSISHRSRVIYNYNEMQDYIEALIMALILDKEDYIIEGDSISLNIVKKIISMGHDIRILVVGYPNINVNDLYNNIKNNRPNQHWSYDCSDDRIFSKAKEFISQSKILKKEALENNFPFLDIGGLTCQDIISNSIDILLK